MRDFQFGKAGKTDIASPPETEPTPVAAVVLDWRLPDKLALALRQMTAIGPLIRTHKRREEARVQSEALRRVWWTLSQMQRDIVNGRTAVPIARAPESGVLVIDTMDRLGIDRALAVVLASMRHATYAAEVDGAVKHLGDALALLTSVIEKHSEAING